MEKWLISSNWNVSKFAKGNSEHYIDICYCHVMIILRLCYFPAMIIPPIDLNLY